MIEFRDGEALSVAGATRSPLRSLPLAAWRRVRGVGFRPVADGSASTFNEGHVMTRKAETMQAMFRWSMAVLLAVTMLTAAGTAHGRSFGSALVLLFAGAAVGMAAGRVDGGARGEPPLPFGQGEYDGERDDQGEPDGKGGMKFPDGTEIECPNWRNGKPNGPCRLKRPDGRVQDSVWCNGRPCGTRHVIKWPGPDGPTWRGGVRDGLPHGEGVMESPEGGRYEGEVRNGHPHGEGVMESPEGVIYEGEWIRGDPYGRGVMTWPDGRRYEGEFRIGDPHGQGVMTWPDGRRYEGAFRIGDPYGQGVMTWPDGRRHEGEFRIGDPHGYGVMTWPNGRRHEGVFRIGELLD